jgi:hypothetical protein
MTLTLAAYLDGPITVGEADVAGPLTVFPLFGPAPRLPYRSFAAAAVLGATVTELEGTASVNDLLAHNPTDLPFLLYEGEEVLGAQQNRTVDAPVLVPAAAKLSFPVTCVEQGRWDGARHGEAFRPAPQTAFPELRRRKSVAMHARLAAGMPSRADQGIVWETVAGRAAAEDAAAPTGAMHDVYEGRRRELDDLAAKIPLHEGQCGAIAALAGRPAVLDFVSRADVFADLHGPLVQGYALDAIRAASATSMPGHPEDFLETVVMAPLHERDGIGLGREGRFSAGGTTGGAVISERELIQLSAFTDEQRLSSIARPSRRRR